MAYVQPSWEFTHGFGVNVGNYPAKQGEFADSWLSTDRKYLAKGGANYSPMGLNINGSGVALSLSSVSITADFITRTTCSIEAWIFVNKTIAGTYYVYYNYTSASAYFYMYVTASAFAVTAYDGANTALASTAVTFTAGSWYHLYMTNSMSAAKTNYSVAVNGASWVQDLLRTVNAEGTSSPIIGKSTADNSIILTDLRRYPSHKYTTNVNFTPDARSGLNFSPVPLNVPNRTLDKSTYVPYYEPLLRGGRIKEGEL